MLYHFRSLLIIILFSLYASRVSGQPAFIKDSLDVYVNRAMLQWNIPGIAVCIVKNGRVEVMKGYGVQSLTGKQKVNDETLFMIASNTKAFTGTSLALLDYEKRMSLDDKVTKYIPWFKLYDKDATNEVRICDLLCHRLGLKTFQGDFLNWGGNLSRKQIIEKMAFHKPAYSFRYRYGYCNAAFLTAGEIIPVVTDTSWDDFLKFRYFIPLRMNRTSTTFNTIINDKNAAKPYTLSEGKLFELKYPDIDNLGPAASINSCIKDLANWMLMQLDSGKFDGKQIVPFKVLQKTRTPQTLVNQLNPTFPSMHFSAYGLGWELEDYGGKKIIRHDGGADGFVTSVCLIPEENLGIVVLTNTDANWMYDGIRHQIIDAYFNIPYRDYNALYFSRYSKNIDQHNSEIKTKRAIVLKNSTPLISMQQFAGEYQNDVYGTMEIRYVSNQLKMSFEHHPSLTGILQYMNNDTFLCSYSNPTYGIKEIPFKIVDNKILNCTVTVSDFIDSGEYEFTKTNN